MIGALLAGLLAVAAQAQNGLSGATFRDFSGGYVDTVESSSLQPNQSPQLLNVIIDEGGVKPRLGFTQCGVTPSGNTPTNLYQFAKSDGSKNLIVTDNQNIYSTRDCLTFTTIATGLSSTAQVYFAVVRDKLWIVNGSTWPYTWDGTTATILDGRNNTPSNAPKCAYPEFWRERVWCARTTANQSALYFTDLADSLGNDIDPSTHTAAFPTANVFQIDQNGGSPIYGVRAFNDRLYVFKDNGIWEVQFNSEFENSIRKTASSIGSRFHSAIKEVDGILYFVGKDGIYAFDGDNSTRLTGLLENKFYALNQPQTSENYKTWDAASDWDDGTLHNTTTSTIVGSVVLSNNAIPASLNPDFETGDSTNWAMEDSYGTCSGGQSASVVADTSLQGSYLGKLVVTKCVFDGDIAQCNPTGTASPTYHILNGAGTELLTGTATVGTNTVDLSSLATTYVRLEVRGTVAENGNYVRGKMTAGFTRGTSITFRLDSATANTGGCAGYTTTYKFDDLRNAGGTSTGTWHSEIYNAVSVSSWTTFEADTVANGGSFAFQYRVGRDTNDVSTRSWTSIISGGVISGTTDQIYVQIMSSFTAASSTSTSPELQIAQISWNTGGSSSNKIFLSGWKNRVWVSASSGTATANNLVLVKSRLPLQSWSIYDLQIGPMITYSDYFYAGASTHSAIYRIESGTNDYGRAIPWFVDSRDEIWNEPNRKKYLLELSADFKKGTGAGTFIGYSSDYGASFTNRTVIMTGSGRGSTRQYVNGGLNLSYRFRVGSNTLDDSVTFTGVTGWARPSTLRE